MNQRLYHIKSTVINQPLELEAKVYIFILNKAYEDICSRMRKASETVYYIITKYLVIKKKSYEDI